MRFAGMDRNRDGRITRDEWRGSTNAFNRHDWNGDGVLSGIEVIPGARRPGNGGQQDEFDRLDTNDDGFLSRDSSGLTTTMTTGRSSSLETHES